MKFSHFEAPGMHMLTPAAAAAADAGRVSRVVLPLLFLASMLNYLDRGNISFAALQMNGQLGISLQDFGLGSGLFFLGEQQADRLAANPSGNLKFLLA
jgi:hypothetical protein